MATKRIIAFTKKGETRYLVSLKSNWNTFGYINDWVMKNHGQWEINR
jgi:hypothetical protein